MPRIEQKRTHVKPVLVLRKARSILDALGEHATPRTFSEIVDETGLPVTTCHRLLRTLVVEGFLSHRDGRYAIGPKVLAWAQTATHSYQSVDVEAASGELKALRDATGETTGLVVRDGLQGSLVALCETKHPVVRIVKLGEIQALHTASGGKVFLAYDSKLLEAVLDGGFDGAPSTAKSLRDAEALRTEMSVIRTQGYATSFEEREVGTGSVSAPIFDATSRVTATIGIIGPIQRVNAETVPAWIPDLLAAAARLSSPQGTATSVSG